MQITIRLRDQFGTTVAHPVCDTAKAFAQIAKSKTLTEDTLKIIAGMGFDIKLADEVCVSAARSTPLSRFSRPAAFASRRIAQ